MQSDDRVIVTHYGIYWLDVKLVEACSPGCGP